MTTANQSRQVLYGDPEHGGLRVAVLAVLMISLLVAFVLVRFALQQLAAGSALLDFAFVLSCGAAVPIALGVTWLAETVMKRVWPSGERVVVDERGVHHTFKLEDNEKEEVTQSVLWSSRINVTRWTFRLRGYPRAGRERRVPDKWLCLACELQQDDTRLIFYTYMPPEPAETYMTRQPAQDGYQQISLATLYSEAGARRWEGTTRPDIPSQMLAGPNGRFWLAERRRWLAGVELTPTDFATLMDAANSHTL